MRRLSILAVVALASLGWAACAIALDTAVDSKTYVQARQTAQEKLLAPFYEYLDLRLDNMADRDVSLSAGGWVRADLAEVRQEAGESDGEEGEERFDSELNYAYLRFALSPQHIAYVGRINVFEGVASEQIDGAYARADLPKGIGLSLYAGLPAEADDEEGDALIYGGRISHEVQGKCRLGVSYLNESTSGNDFRQEAGIDLWAGLSKADLTGRSSYNLESSGFMEHNYQLRVGPFSKAVILADMALTDYEHYFTASTLSAFTADPNESSLRAGAGLEYTLSDALKADAMYRNISYEIMGAASEIALNLKYLESTYSAGASISRVMGDTDGLKYSVLRAYTSKQMGPLAVVLDILDVSYDEERNGVKNAYAIVGALGYELITDGVLGIDAEYGHNPDFDSELKAMVKFTYKFRKGA